MRQALSHNLLLGPVPYTSSPLLAFDHYPCSLICIFYVVALAILLDIVVEPDFSDEFILSFELLPNLRHTFSDDTLTVSLMQGLLENSAWLPPVFLHPLLLLRGTRAYIICLQSYGLSLLSFFFLSKTEVLCPSGYMCGNLWSSRSLVGRVRRTEFLVNSVTVALHTASLPRCTHASVILPECQISECLPFFGKGTCIELQGLLHPDAEMH